MSLVLNGNGITSANIADGAITNADIADDAITDAKLASGGGKVLQVVQANYNSQLTNSTSTYANTGFSVTITPSSTTSKILITVNGGSPFNSTTDDSLECTIYRGATDISPVVGQPLSRLYHAGATGLIAPHSMSILDAPASTSAIVYSPFFKGTATNNVYFNLVNYTVTITAMEIGV